MTSIAHDLIGICFICKRRHDNVGVSASERHPIKWICKPCLESTNAQKVYHMPRKQLDEYERLALAEGGNAAGSYLDEIGKTDLAALSEEEWATFLGCVLKGYADGMREIVSREIPY